MNKDEAQRVMFFAGLDAATSDAGLGYSGTPERERHYQAFLALHRCSRCNHVLDSANVCHWCPK